MSKKNQNYDEFIEKFKPKKTTDDCYTPPPVYEAVLDWAIFSKICNWYVEHGIPFLLFAPAMSSIRQNVTYIGVSCTITYENGANVNTAFVTNMMGDPAKKQNPKKAYGVAQYTEKSLLLR